MHSLKQLLLIIVIVIVASIIIFFEAINYTMNISTQPTTTIMESRTRIMVLVDNHAYTENLRTAWGISIYIERNNYRLLFDTGPSPDILEYNARMLGINLSSIKAIVLSHEHGDHIGGVDLFSHREDVTLYVPKGFPSSIVGKFKEEGFRIAVINNTTSIYDGIYVLEPLYGPPWEQSLVIDTSKGLVIITGCSHPGIVNIVEKAVETFNKNHILLLGVFI